MSSNSNFDRNLSLQLSLPRENVCVQTPVALSDLRHVDNTRTILNFLAEGQNTFLLTGWKFVILKCLLVFVSGCLRLLSLILSTPRARQGRVTAPLAHKISGEIEFYSKMRRNACLKNKNDLLLFWLRQELKECLSVAIISSQEHSFSSLKIIIHQLDGAWNTSSCYNSSSDLRWRVSPHRGGWPDCSPRVASFYRSRGGNTLTPSRINLFSHRDTFIVLNINAQNKIVENSF